MSKFRRRIQGRGDNDLLSILGSRLQYGQDERQTVMACMTASWYLERLGRIQEGSVHTREGSKNVMWCVQAWFLSCK